MSLAGRLLLVVLLAVVGIGAATAVVLRTRHASDAAREETARASADSLAAQLRAKRDALPPGAAGANATGIDALRKLTASLLAPLSDASAGYCLPDGTLLVRETVVPHGRELRLPDSVPAAFQHLRGNIHHPKGMGILPLDRDAVVEACRAHTGGVSHARLVAPRDILSISVAGGHAPFAAWALTRTAKQLNPEDRLTPKLFALVGLALLALLVLCVDTIVRMRRGIRALGSALVAVQSDLDTPIPRPSPGEFAQIADGLRQLTAHLSESRQRELALERNLSHERRLAALGRVAAGVAHEIRNPLASIKLRLDGMARRKLDERSVRDVHRSLDEVARLDAVVGSLLLVARKQPALLEHIDLGLLVDERLAALEPFASGRAIRVLRTGAAEARVDRTGMARVIDNLVRNSVEASPQGAEVVVELEAADEVVVLRVVDSGQGIASARQGELFEPFFTSKPDGTGLGLSLSRAAVEAHGGTLSYSRNGGATQFTVRLPRGNVQA